jgi:hypothetical protein
LAVLGLPAVLDGQNVIAVQLEMALKSALSFNTFIDNNFVIFFNVSGRPWWSWGCRLFWMHKIQYTPCTIMTGCYFLQCSCVALVVLELQTVLDGQNDGKVVQWETEIKSALPFNTFIVQ